MKKITKIAGAGAGFAPLMALATGADFTWVDSIVAGLQNVITALIPLLIALALVVFIWGVVKFISASDDTARDDGKKKMIWGIVGLFVIIAVWGLVALLSEILGVGGVAEPSIIPGVPQA